MSTLSNISPVATPGSQQDGGEPTNPPEAQTGVMGLFEQLIAEAISSDSNPQTGSQKVQAQSPVLSVKMAKEHPNAAQQSAAFQANLIKISNSAEATSKNALLAKTDPNLSTTEPVSKSVGASKTEKNSLTQVEVKAASAAVSPEMVLNQMLAAAIPASHNPEAVPSVPAQSYSGTSAKTAINGSILSHRKQAPPTVTRISESDLAEEKDALPVQPMASSKASLIETKNVELLAKNSEDSNAADPTDVALSKSNDASGTENSPSDPTGASSGPAAASPSAPNGTSIANQDMSMKQAEKTDKVAGQTEKVLPGDAVSIARAGSALPYSSHGEQLTTVAGSSPASSSSNGVTSLSGDSTIVPATANLRNGTLARTQEMVTLNAVRLSDSGNNSMQVVIKPDAGTQLSLELRQQGGSVQVQAVLQQGDFNHLNQQWPDLQQRMDQRGIQLAPLSDDGASSNSGGSHETFQQKQSQPTEVVPEMTLTASPAGRLAPESAPSSNHRGWETWA